jgi:hypothetical protein
VKSTEAYAETMNFAELEINGWCETSATDIGELSDQIIDMGKELGNPVEHRKSIGIVQKLVPIAAEDSFPNSLSSKYSRNEFPLHVDTAHWVTPCRYLILGCLSEGESNRKTVLLDYTEIDITNSEKHLLFNSPFKISNGRNSFYGQVLSKKRNFIRYDPGCMTPATNQGKGISYLFSEERIKGALKKITWETGKIVIIDNWRILHGRGASMNDGHDRVLYRVLVA